MSPSLTVYQQHHLRVVFDHHVAHLYPAMVTASKAHVVMLAEQGLISDEAAATMLRGLVALAGDRPEELEYEGSVEDIYYTLEKRLAAAAGIEVSQLSVQLARSRNDLDAGVFRMVLRDQLLQVLDALLATGRTVLDRADRHADVVITGYTHRRPAQPTSIGHVFAGYAEALAGEAAAYAGLLDEMNRSPLGSCAFAGTDLDISPRRLAAAVRPELVLRRAQGDGPGEAAVRDQVGRLSTMLDAVQERAQGLRERLTRADAALAEAVAARVGP
ncbi:lyase family protein [Micromonospora sp. HUAS YX12]|uniref:Lyase family protein n=1 Tax=Micromonospora sp. HUAS YX12 TaxID=3156396 RepID=A0AAU7QV28_9ACTN